MVTELRNADCNESVVELSDHRWPSFNRSHRACTYGSSFALDSTLCGVEHGVCQDPDLPDLPNTWTRFPSVSS